MCLRKHVHLCRHSEVAAEEAAAHSRRAAPQFNWPAQSHLPGVDPRPWPALRPPGTCRQQLTLLPDSWPGLLGSELPREVGPCPLADG